MIRPDYRDRYELYHFGVQGRSGRYPWGSGYRPYQRLEGKRSKMEKRLGKKFSKANAKTGTLQNKANRYFNKANIQRNSRLRSARKRADETFNRGFKQEERKQRIEYRMSKRYERYQKKFEKLNITMSDELKTQGLDYYNRVLANTSSSYQAALNKRVS